MFFTSNFHIFEKMNCREIIRCNLSILVALLFVPQPKVLAQSSLPGCQAKLGEPYVIQKQLPELTPADIIGNTNVEQVGTQQNPLKFESPFKLSATKEVPTFWQMRVTNTDYESIRGKNATYKIKIVFAENQTGNPFLKADAKHLGSIQQITTCTDGTVVVGEGVALEFRELSQLVVKGTFKAEIEVCVPTNKQC